MPGGSTLQRGNELFAQMIYLPSVTVPNVNANATATQTFTVKGVVIGDLIAWNQQSEVTGISVENVRVSATDTLTFYWSNTTGSNVTSTGAQPFLIQVTRAENTAESGLAGLPNGIY